MQLRQIQRENLKTKGYSLAVNASRIKKCLIPSDYKGFFAAASRMENDSVVLYQRKCNVYRSECDWCGYSKGNKDSVWFAKMSPLAMTALSSRINGNCFWACSFTNNSNFMNIKRSKSDCDKNYD